MYNSCNINMIESIDYFEYTSPSPNDGALFGESLAPHEPSTSSLSVSGMSLKEGAPIIPYPGFRVQREALHCPPRDPHMASTLVPGLSRRKRNISYSLFRYSGLKGSFFFISVQAMMSSFAASFTLILVLMPFSLSLPRSVWV